MDGEGASEYARGAARNELILSIDVDFDHGDNVMARHDGINGLRGVDFGAVGVEGVVEVGAELREGAFVGFKGPDAASSVCSHARDGAVVRSDVDERAGCVWR